MARAKLPPSEIRPSRHTRSRRGRRTSTEGTASVPLEGAPPPGGPQLEVSAVGESSVVPDTATGGQGVGLVEETQLVEPAVGDPPAVLDTAAEGQSVGLVGETQLVEPAVGDPSMVPDTAADGQSAGHVGETQLVEPSGDPPAVPDTAADGQSAGDVGETQMVESAGEEPLAVANTASEGQSVELAEETQLDEPAVEEVQPVRTDGETAVIAGQSGLDGSSAEGTRVGEPQDPMDWSWAIAEEDHAALAPADNNNNDDHEERPAPTGGVEAQPASVTQDHAGAGSGAGEEEQKSEEGPQIDDCYICKSYLGTMARPSIQEGEVLFFSYLECGHKYCKDCLSSWLRTRPVPWTCPYCNEPSEVDDVDSLTIIAVQSHTARRIQQRLNEEAEEEQLNRAEREAEMRATAERMRREARERAERMRMEEDRRLQEEMRVREEKYHENCMKITRILLQERRLFGQLLRWFLTSEGELGLGEKTTAHDKVLQMGEDEVCFCVRKVLDMAPQDSLPKIIEVLCKVRDDGCCDLETQHQLYRHILGLTATEYNEESADDHFHDMQFELTVDIAGRYASTHERYYMRHLGLNDIAPVRFQVMAALKPLYSETFKKQLVHDDLDVEEVKLPSEAYDAETLNGINKVHERKRMSVYQRLTLGLYGVHIKDDRDSNQKNFRVVQKDWSIYTSGIDNECDDISVLGSPSSSSSPPINKKPRSLVGILQIMEANAQNNNIWIEAAPTLPSVASCATFLESTRFSISRKISKEGVDSFKESVNLSEIDLWISHYAYEVQLATNDLKKIFEGLGFASVMPHIFNSQLVKLRKVQEARDAMRKDLEEREKAAKKEAKRLERMSTDRKGKRKVERTVTFPRMSESWQSVQGLNSRLNSLQNTGEINKVH